MFFFFHVKRVFLKSLFTDLNVVVAAVIQQGSVFPRCSAQRTHLPSPSFSSSSTTSLHVAPASVAAAGFRKRKQECWSVFQKSLDTFDSLGSDSIELWRNVTVSNRSLSTWLHAGCFVFVYVWRVLNCGCCHSESFEPGLSSWNSRLGWHS